MAKSTGHPLPPLLQRLGGRTALYWGLLSYFAPIVSAAAAEGEGTTHRKSPPHDQARFLPQAQSLEFGLYTGAFFVSPDHSLRSQTLPQQAYGGPAFEMGARLAYFPIPYLGVEGDFSFADGRFSNDLSDVDQRLVANRGSLAAYRAQMVGQLPYSSLVPYTSLGVGALAASSQVQGRNTDFLFHLGAGIKIQLMQDLALRAEFRENLHNRANDRYAGIAFSEELNLGVAFRWGGSSAEPLADRDSDGRPDSIDGCPDVAALTEDGCPGDEDGDGIPDPDDACPGESGTLENGCPERDTDRDGVPLPCDACPDEKGVAPTGCIDDDSDNDGVVGRADRCPDSPETRNGFEDADGCPDRVPEEVERFTGTILGISFPQGQADIEPASEGVLTEAAQLLRRHPSIRVEISGHTSSEGDPDFNRDLSSNRARAVREWLIQAGVPGSQLEARGAGATEPMGDNATPEGRQMNRRIEFRILSAEPDGATAENQP